ncbi:related to monooxygenase [Sporisorium scitamineum]|uniref:Related to monooxygenase n=1 Tax=Sporisorium scitamineum TaxID=49012 RepID=A0A127ZG33_9BASI|nr:related to monooxygenase [Sporisorium scitamineum]
MAAIPEPDLGHNAKQAATIDDVLIVGAGISGINASCRFTDSLPPPSYTLLEGRHTLSGTWDLFKYPGIRSDADSAHDRLCLSKHGVRGTRQPLQVEIPGVGSFTGIVVHPQRTMRTRRLPSLGQALLLSHFLPPLAGKTKHVTLVQRSPSYVVATNPINSIADLLQKWLPEKCASFVDQSIGLSPNGEFLSSVSRDSNASIATGNIPTIKTIEADIIVYSDGTQRFNSGRAAAAVSIWSSTGKPRLDGGDKFVWGGEDAWSKGVPQLRFPLWVLHPMPAWTTGLGLYSHTLWYKCFRSWGRRWKQQVVNSQKAMLEGMWGWVEASMLGMSSTYIAKAKGYMPKTATTGPVEETHQLPGGICGLLNMGLFDQLVFE